MITEQQAKNLQELETIILKSVSQQDYAGCIGRLHFKVDLLRQEIKKQWVDTYNEFKAALEGKEVIPTEESKKEDASKESS
jgi:hypothetical protein